MWTVNTVLSKLTFVIKYEFDTQICSKVEVLLTESELFRSRAHLCFRQVRRDGHLNMFITPGYTRRRHV